MEAKHIETATRVGAYTAIAGSLCALTGAALWGLSGADLDAALATGDTASYLTAAGDASLMLVTNLTIWIVMIFLMGIAATAMASLSGHRPVIARFAMFCYWVGAPLVMAAYVAWLAVVVQIAPATSPEAIMAAEVVGWFASRADWVATILVLGIGPPLLSLAGREDWVPTWLARWSVLTAVAGVLNAVAMLTGGSGLTTYGFVIIPIGVGWMLAAGIVLFRQIGALQRQTA
ncbi:MAG TPA: hypothetical protein VKP65_19300 [Rhodothermales bacterium]|nr:hypothetical protein [Rhodothermales bacterium]